MAYEMLVCEVCRREGEETEIPADGYGVAMMKAHLWEKHEVAT